jgi:DNA-binding YbaB/EbfC family protein
MKGGLGNIMQQAQKMQEKMKKAQEEIALLEVHGESGGGMVKLTMTGRHEVRQLKIDDSVLTDDKDMLEDLLVAAINDAVRKVETEVKSKFAGLTGGLNLPAGFNLPF